MVHTKKLSLIRELFHEFISKITSLQTVAYFFTYRLGELSPGYQINEEIKKEIADNIEKIKNYCKLSSEILKEIEQKLIKAGIYKKCEPFTKSMREETAGIYKQLVNAKTTYNGIKNSCAKKDIIDVINAFQKFDPHCLKIADVYRKMKDSSVLES